jgi:hypothetical protein
MMRYDPTRGPKGATEVPGYSFGNHQVLKCLVKRQPRWTPENVGA